MAAMQANGQDRSGKRLTDVQVRRLAKVPGMHHDGAGLYLRVGQPHGCSWVVRFMIGGKARTMGLGSLRDVPLTEARKRAAAARLLKSDGVDPIEQRGARRAALRAERARAVSFDWCRDQYVASHSAGWRSAKYALQWVAALKTYVTPVFGNLPVQVVDLGLVTKVIEPLWRTKPETAGRVRARVEAILDWAKVKGHRQGDNPAKWRGHLDKLLPGPSEVRKVEHRPALPYAELGAFMKLLWEREGVAARALEFTIATAARTGEVIGARWTEIDRVAGVWTVPAERMKMDREHRVLLNSAAIAVLDSVSSGQQGEFVFPGDRAGRPISNMAMLMVLRRMERDDLTVHGFRSTFKTWATECTAHPNDAIEISLSHTVGDAVEQAYLRGDLLEKRRRLMDDWAAFYETRPS
jgi:integrase